MVVSYLQNYNNNSSSNTIISFLVMKKILSLVQNKYTNLLLLLILFLLSPSQINASTPSADSASETSSAAAATESFLPSLPETDASDGSKDLYWCAVSSCQGAISVGRTLVVYNAPTHRHLSFIGNQDILILGKPVGNGDYWIGKVLRNGRAGLVPKELIREERILKHSEKHNMTLDLLLLFANADTNFELKDETVEKEPVESVSDENTEKKHEETTTADTAAQVSPDTENSSIAEEESVTHATPEASLEKQDEELPVPVVPSEVNSDHQEHEHHSHDEPIEEELNEYDDEESAEEKIEETIIAETATQRSPDNENSPIAEEESVTRDTPEESLENKNETISIPTVPSDVNSDNKDEKHDLQVDPIEEEPKESTNDANAEKMLEGTTTAETATQAPPDIGNSSITEEESETPATPEASLETQDENLPIAAVPSEVVFDNQDDKHDSRVEPTEEEPNESTINANAEKELEGTTTAETATETPPGAENSSITEEESVTPASSEASLETQDENLSVPADPSEAIFDHQDHEHHSHDEPIEEEPKDSPNNANSEKVVEETTTAETATQVPLDTENSSITEEESVTLVTPRAGLENQDENVSSPTVPSETTFYHQDHEHHLHDEPIEEEPKESANDANAEQELKETTTAEAAIQACLDAEGSSNSEVESVCHAGEKLSIPVSSEVNFDHHGHEHHSHVEHNEEEPKESPNDGNAEKQFEETTTAETVTQQSPDGEDSSVAEEDYLTPATSEASLGNQDEKISIPTIPSGPGVVGNSDNPPEEELQSKNNSFFNLARHLSSTLLSFLPEYLQDTILDVNDALIFTGIIALLIVGICVPYFFLETFLSSRPLKKKVVDLNKTLWKVSTAYENQQDEFEMFKKKAYSHDEDLKRIEQLELQLDLLKKMDQKQKDKIKEQKQQLISRVKLEVEVTELVESTMNDLRKVESERDQLKSLASSLQSALKSKVTELESIIADLSSKEMDIELLNNTKEHLENKATAFENEISELKNKLNSEVAKKRDAKEKLEEQIRLNETIQDDLDNLRKIAHQYEETVNNLTTEISLKENELFSLKDSLGDDSPLVEIAEIKAKLNVAEEDSKSLQSRVDSITLENKALSKRYEESKATLATVTDEKDQAQTRLQVLEKYFKEKEEELRTIVERQQVEQEIRGKDKNELFNLIQEKISEINDLNERIEELKSEFEETKTAHRNEIRALEAKNHENWLALCQSERKGQDAKKEAEALRQKLTQVVKERGDENDTLLDGDEFFEQILPLDLLPPPLSVEEISPSYFGLGTDFMPPPPLPLDGEDESNPDLVSPSSRRADREPQRPPPVGRISPNDSDSEITDMSPIVVDHGRGARYDYSDGSASPTGRPLSRDSWMNGTSGSHNNNNNNNIDNHNNNNNNNNHDRTDQRRRHPNHGPKSSSPIQERGSSNLC